MKIEEIPVDKIHVADRLRPVTEDVIPALAANIARDGLRQPIEVAKALGGNWVLVAGAHRLAACKHLGWETIPAVIVIGTKLALRQRELMENLARNELSVLERCQFVAELKKLFEEEHPEARNHVSGGLARQGNQRMPNLAIADWYAEVALRSDRSVRVIQREASIGERLWNDAADKLRGTAFEDKQAELEALARLAPPVQTKAAELVTRKTDPQPSIRAAIAFLDGRTKVQEEGDKKLLKLIDAWERAGKKTRVAFLDWLREHEMIALREDDR